MTRCNYRQSRFERVVGRRPDIAIDRHMRSPLIAIGAALLLTAVAYGVEWQRVAVLDAELSILQDRITIAKQADIRVDMLGQSVAQLRDVRTAVAGLRRDTIVVTNTIARIGNELPSETWLTSVQPGRTGTWSIVGRSTRVDQIGATLASIGELDHAATARLVSINAAGKTGRLLDFIIAWEHQQ